MTSRPPQVVQVPTFSFPTRPQTATSTTSSASRTNSYSYLHSLSSSTASRIETSNISSITTVHGRPSRPGLVSRVSESSTQTIRSRHLSSKSQSAVPTLSHLNVGNNELPTYLKSPKKMTASHGSNGGSSGAADLLRQAMMQR
ncbi:hypothetical protein GQ44DRAFT_697295 [Phaeosphaeriaceae sp. PMI808]|nr:hypothetical protein GQ44DRAFT_697295 [Phaeosphaeriaceae sp. PMI808]